MKKSFCAATLIWMAFFGFTALGESGAAAYEALGVRVQDVLSGTVLSAKVVPGSEKQVVCVVTYFTGKKDPAEAVNVRMGVFRRSGDELVSIYRRDFGEEQGGHVANGDLELLDVDRDGLSEIVVSYDNFKQPLVEQRNCEVLVREGEAFRAAWTGPVEFDATKAARGVPQERRDRFTREFDWVKTMRTRGVTLFVKKEMIAVAGERLDQPKIVEETFPLRPAPDHW